MKRLIIAATLAISLLFPALSFANYPGESNKGETKNKDNTCGSDSSSSTHGNKEEKCKCTDSNGTTCNKCLSVEMPFGSMPHEGSLPDGFFYLYSETARLTLFSPQGLLFSHPLMTSIFKVSGGEVGILTPEAKVVSFSFPADSSEGSPTGSDADSPLRLRMTDASGNPVTSSPSRYVLLYGDGSSLSLSASLNDVSTGVRLDPAVLAMANVFTSSTGRVLTLSSPGVGLTPVFDESGAIRQVRSQADGLADIVAVSDYKYEIRLYSPSGAGAFDSGTGLWTPSGSPHTVWAIENPNASDTNINTLTVSKTVGGNTATDSFTYSSAVSDWVLSKSAGSVVSARSVTWNSSKTDAVSTYSVTDSQGSPSYLIRESIKKIGSTEVVTERVSGCQTGGPNLITSYAYDENPSSPTYGFTTSVSNPDGSWEAYEYDSSRRRTLLVEPWLDSAYGSAASAAKATYSSYAPVDGSDTVSFGDTRPRCVEVKVLGVTVERTFYAYKTVSGEFVEIEERAASPSAAYGDSGNMRTTRTYYGAAAGEASAGRLKSVSFPDGTLDTYSYEYGSYSPGVNAPGTFTPDASGLALRTSVVHGTAASPAGVAYKTAKGVSVSDSLGNGVLSETCAYTGSSYERIDWTVKSFDAEHHELSSLSSNGALRSATWNCCSKDSETLEDGTEYTYAYDSLKRLVAKTKKGIGSQADIVSSYTYDSSNRQLSETVSAGGLSLSSSVAYDTAGRLTSSTDARGLATAYAYANGGRVETRTLPGGATVITTKYFDGRLKSVAGTAVVPECYDYGVDSSDGSLWSRSSYLSVSGVRYVKSTTDFLGRASKTETPGYNATLTKHNTYNSAGRLVKVSQSGYADILYEYDSLGNLVREGLDMNSSGTLDLASTDRMSEWERVYASESGSWWEVETSKVYGTTNGSTPTTVSVRKSRLTGLASGVVSEVKDIDIYGNTTTSTTSIDRTNKTVTQTTDVPDSNVDAQVVIVNGLKTSERTQSNLTYAFGYDSLGRRTSSTDPRTGTTAMVYNTSSQISSITDPASNSVTYSYEAATGRKSSETDALGNTTLYTYNSMDKIVSLRGTAQYPVDYVYDSYGKMTQLKTYRGSSADTTTWTYNAATGLLISKTDASGNSVAYTYTSNGKLASRSWARGVMTSYAYNAAGNLTSIDYADSTPDVTISYNRLGQKASITDALGSRTFTYNSTLDEASESMSGLYTKTLSRSYDALGRGAGINISTEYDVDYAYDTAGRFSTLTNGSDTFTYSRLANSELISGIAYPHDISVAKSYEAHRDALTSVENTYGAATRSKYDYVNDSIGRRTSMAKSGSAFTASDTISYGYDSRSQVTSALAQNEALYNYSYNFDNIGNRTSSSERGVSSTYTSNNLNQYTLIDITTPSYDADGNMTTDGMGWAYTWNAENRIIAKTSGTTTITYNYDYAGRRVEEKVATGGAVVSQIYFVYDGWNKIEELDALSSNAVSKKYVWGLDVSGSLYATGSVGALLSETNTDGTFYATYDANGNVSEYLSSAGAIAVHYEYGPFGQTTSQSGSLADSFRFRFSTKPVCFYNGDYDYSLRDYSPSLGRWRSKDPIGERGGYNLYAMVSNNPIGKLDKLGLLQGMINLAEEMRQYNAAQLEEKNAINEAKQEAMLREKFGQSTCVIKELAKVIKANKEGKLSPVRPNDFDLIKEINPDFDKTWEDLTNPAIEYFSEKYSSFTDWNVTETIPSGFGPESVGLNAPFAAPQIRASYLEKSPPLTVAAEVLIHEPLHDMNKYGFGHGWPGGTNDFRSDLIDNVRVAESVARSSKASGCCRINPNNGKKYTNQLERIQCRCGVQY